MFRFSGSYMPLPFFVHIRPHFCLVSPFVPSPAVAFSRSIHSCLSVPGALSLVERKAGP